LEKDTIDICILKLFFLISIYIEWAEGEPRFRYILEYFHSLIAAVIILFPMMGNMEEKKASLSIPGF
jgi:hypothetical protein